MKVGETYTLYIYKARASSRFFECNVYSLQIIMIGWIRNITRPMLIHLAPALYVKCISILSKLICIHSCLLCNFDGCVFMFSVFSLLLFEPKSREQFERMMILMCFVRLVSYFHSIAIAWPFWLHCSCLDFDQMRVLFHIRNAKSYLVFSNMRRDVTIFHSHILTYTMNAECNFHINNTMSYIIKWVSCWIPAPVAMQWEKWMKWNASIRFATK